MKKTLQEHLCDALAAQGEREVLPSPSTRYRTFTRQVKPGTFYFVGRNGALRSGATVTGSISISESFKSKLIRRTAP